MGCFAGRECVAALVLVETMIVPGGAEAQVAPSATATSSPSPEDLPPSEHATRRPKRTADNSVFFELFGNAFLYSFNYEHIFEDSNVSVRGGVGYWHTGPGTVLGFSSPSSTDIVVPALVSYYLGESAHKLQLGAGPLLWSHDEQGFGDKLYVGATLVVGYRYLPPKGGFNFGAGFTPTISTGPWFGVFAPWAGVSFGAGF